MRSSPRPALDQGTVLSIAWPRTAEGHWEILRVFRQFRVSRVHSFLLCGQPERQLVAITEHETVAATQSERGIPSPGIRTPRSRGWSFPILPRGLARHR